MANWQEVGKIELPTYQSTYDPSVYGPLILQKQQDYDLGVEKIQGIMDSVAGLPVVRPEDKAYLQNQVNSLTTELNSLVGADYSSKNIVSKVGRYASRLAADPVIQDAVISSKNLEALRASQEELKAKHPERYTPQAEYEDQLAIERYLNSTGRAKFDRRTATQYYDFEKPLQELLKQIHPSVSYTITPNGQFEYIVDKSTGITPSQIKEAVNGFFATNPQYREAVRLNAQYQYRGMDATAFQNRVTAGLQSQYAQLVALNEQYKEELDMYKGDPRMTQMIQRKIADNIMDLKGLEVKAAEYKNLFESGADIEAIKDTFMFDQIRNMFAVTYQQSELETTFEENKAKIQEYKYEESQKKLFLDFMKAGIDPDTLEPIGPGHPYYGAVLASQRASRKTGDGGEYAVDEFPTTVISGQVTNIATVDKLTEQIETNTNQLKELDNKLFTAYAQRYHSSLPNESLKKGYEAWKAQQEANIRHKGTADQDYLQYKNQVRDIEDNLDTYTALLKAAGEYANSQVQPLRGIVTVGFGNNQAQVNLSDVNTITSINKIDEIHKEWTDAVVSLKRGVAAKAFGLDFNPFNDIADIKAQDEALKARYLQAINTELANLPPEVRNAIGDHYIKAADGSQYDNASVKQVILQVTLPSKEYVSNLLTQQNKYLNDRILQANPQGIIVPTDEKSQNKLKGYAVMAHRDYLHRKEGGDPDDIDVKKDKLQVKSVYQDPITDQQMIIYDYDGTEYVQPIASTDNVLGSRAQSNSQLYRNLQLHPIGKLVRTTTNGKLQYEIGKSPLGGYYLNVRDGATTIPVTPKVNGRPMVVTDPQELVQRLEEISNAINKETGKPYTKEELIALLYANEY